ncbi:anti-sigma factor family protein [Luteimicrobium sp. NPDC057192]|uniref:anti-sigma factor family protein n=1 Tax=Luteimicrobium sp. NPDC057192 TaxID=3346042 RepID=UPI0036398D21
MTDARTPDDVTAEHERVADWDAAYVLGALDAEDRRAFERHVAVCDRCKDAVADLAGMPALLALVPAEEVPGVVEPAADGDEAVSEKSARADVVDLGAVAARLRRGQVRRRWTAAAVAAGLLVVGGGAGWVVSSAVSPGGGTSVSATATTVDLAPVGGSGVTARLSLDPVAWGTRLSWSCRYPSDAGPASATAGPYGGTARAEATYALVLVDRAGHTTTVGTWAATGTGASGLHASTSVAARDVASVEIRLGDVAVARATA